MSEARAAYEVTRERNGWEVIIGKSVDAHVTLVCDDALQVETHRSSPRVTFSTMLATCKSENKRKDIYISYFCFINSV